MRGRSAVEQRLGELLEDVERSAGGSRDTWNADPAKPVYVISVAAELAGLHAQTLRQYDRLGLVTPERTGGGGRRYSMRDIEQLRQVQELSNEGVSLAGIRRVMELENQVDALRERVEELTEQNEHFRRTLSSGAGSRVFAAGRDGIVALERGQRPRAPRTGRSLVLYRS